MNLLYGNCGCGICPVGAPCALGIALICAPGYGGLCGIIPPGAIPPIGVACPAGVFCPVACPPILIAMISLNCFCVTSFAP